MVNKAELETASRSLTTAYSAAQSLWQRYQQWSDERYEHGLARRRALLAELAGRDAREEDARPTAGLNQRLGVDEEELAAIARMVGQPQRSNIPVPSRAPIGLAELLCEVNDRIDDYPHLVVCGVSRSGKTTLVQLITATRSGQVLILDPKRPKGWEGPKWGGLPYVARAADGSYAPLVAALQAVVKEMVRRYSVMERAS